MIETYIIGDIQNREAKTFGNYTTRQAICGGLGIICNIFMYTKVVPETFDISTRLGLSIMLGLPFYLVGFVKFYGMPLEKVLPTIFYDNFILPQKRQFQVELDDTCCGLADFDILPKKKKKKFMKRIKKDKYKSIYK